MTVNNKRVFYVKYLAHEIYAEILKSRPDVRLDRLENESPDAVAAPILSAAHAYQIGAARDELAKHFHVDQNLLRRAPNLLIVSSNGAGFDPVDVDACTAAGVLVVNQSGGNAHSVAEHALGMLLTLSKRILEADRALRREANVSRNALIGTEGFQSLLRAVGEGWCWAKLSGAHRLSQNAPDYTDARPFHEALVKTNPERLVWGGDWPHPRVEGEMPDAGHLLELFQLWTPDKATQQRILVTNPARLYGFPN